MSIVKFSDVNEKIIDIRGEKVILDSDVAELYGVETREVNQSVKNNPKKFPKGYIFELSKEEKKEVIKYFDNPKIKFSPELPKAFTEKGLYMLATTLTGDKAIQTTIAIIEAFALLRELQRTVAELSEAPEEFQQKSLMQKGGEIIAELLGDDLKTSDTETSFELNFAVLKFKHTIKRK
jgi:phage regulator Rha-like protein